MKYKKDYLLLAAAIVAGLLVVSGGGFADYAKSKAWQHFWAVSAWVGFFAFAGGWFYLFKKDSKK